MKLMKWCKIVLMLCGALLFLSGCYGNMASDTKQAEALSEKDSNIEEKYLQEKDVIVMRDVVFLNRIPGPILAPGIVAWYHGLHSLIDFEEDYEPETLFAYEIVFQHEKSAVINLLKEEGFYVLHNDLDSSVVVAGTMEQYRTVFSRTDDYKGFCLGAFAAVRPDMEEIIEGCIGKKEEGESFSKEWFDANFEKLIPALGTDKNRVTLSVPVIPPEETVPTTE